MAAKIRAKQGTVADLVPEVEALVSTHRVLSDVIAWIGSSGRKDADPDFVTQDEYTHDVIVRYAKSAYLVYDAT